MTETIASISQGAPAGKAMAATGALVTSARTFDTAGATQRVTLNSTAAPDTSHAGKTARPSTAGKRDLPAATALSWTSSQVAEWLSVLGLTKYAPVFEENEVAGSLLLELSNTDLDYLGIKPLAHRKILMKGVAQLRSACGLSAQEGASSTETGSSSAIGSVVASAAPRSKELVHWSHLEPLADPAVQANAFAFSAELDEEAESAAFTEAVMAWRRAVHQGDSADGPARKIEIVREYQQSPKTDPSASLWNNPFSGTSGVSTDVESKSEEQQSLLAGSYDEEAERQAFQAAVMAWRSGSAAAPASISNAAAAMEVAATGSNMEELKCSCYHCFKVFLPTAGYKPPRDELEDEATISGLSLADKKYCCEKCYDATRIALAQLKAEVQTATKQNDDPIQHDSVAAAHTIARLQAMVDAAQTESSDDEIQYPADPTPSAPNVASANVLVFGTGDLRSSPIVTSVDDVAMVLDIAHISAQRAAAKMSLSMTPAARMPAPAVGPVAAGKETTGPPDVPASIDVWNTNFNDYV
jgi:hypothetical protein